MMANKWIHTETVGTGAFYIADLQDGLRFVWLDKHGIANIFKEIGEFMLYLEGKDCARACIEPYETETEGQDFIDHYLGIEG